MNRVDRASLEAVLAAARTLLEAREAQMLTADEWDGIEHAVAACDEPGGRQRVETFAVEHDHLVRRVTPARGESYEHRCERPIYEAVAWAVEEATEPFVLEDLRRAAGDAAPWTQVAVAFAFLKERGCVEPIAGRKHQRAGKFTYEDAMVEWHVLCEENTEGGGDAQSR